MCFKCQTWHDVKFWLVRLEHVWLWILLRLYGVNLLVWICASGNSTQKWIIKYINLQLSLSLPFRLNHLKESIHYKSFLEIGNIVALYLGLPSSLKHCIFNMTFSLIMWRINYLNLWDTFTSPTNVLILFLKLYVLKIPKYKCFVILTGICFFLYFCFCVGYLASKPVCLSSQALFSFLPCSSFCMISFQNWCSHEVFSGY